MTRDGATSRSDAGTDMFKSLTKKAKAKEAKAKESAPPIRVGEHGRYQIKSGRLAGAFIARAFPKPPTKARGMIAEATGATEEAAIIALHSAIDAREQRRTDDRRTDSHTGASVPSIEEYSEALSNVELTRTQSAMIVALALAEEDGLTEEKMAYAAGYKSLASANRSLASADRLISAYLSPEIEPDSNGSSECALIGYRGASASDAAPGNWILHPELREAVRTSL